MKIRNRKKTKSVVNEAGGDNLCHPSPAAVLLGLVVHGSHPGPVQHIATVAGRQRPAEDRGVCIIFQLSSELVTASFILTLFFLIRTRYAKQSLVGKQAGQRI